MKRSSTVCALLLALSATALAQSTDAPPSQPGNFRAILYDKAGGELFWQRSSDDRGAVRGYEITRNGQSLGIRDALSYYDSSLEPDTPYTFTIVAIDNAGQRSSMTTTTLGIGMSPPSSGEPAAPANLRTDVYSAGSAELFWRREPAELLLRYEVLRDGQLVDTTFGVSYYTNELEGGQEYGFEVIAIGRDGSRSEPSIITVLTPGGMDPTPSPVASPANLRSEVYSRSAAELFWDRAATPGLNYEVIRDGVAVGTTSGISFFDNTLAGGNRYRYEVFALESGGQRSAASMISLSTPSDGAGSGTAVLDLDNAESILQEIVSIANGGFFGQFEPVAIEQANEMFSILGPVLSGGEATASRNYALIEGSRDEPNEDGFGINGGRYSCLAGGTAAMPDAFAGEGSRGFTVRFSRCITVSETFGVITLDGEARVIPRAGRGRGEFFNYSDFTIESDTVQLAISGSSSDQANAPTSDRFDGSAERIVPRYSMTSNGMEPTTLSDYNSQRSTRFNPIIDSSGFMGEYVRIATADIAFEVSTPATAGQMLSVDIDLDYDQSGVAEPIIEQLIGQWQSGRILVEAADGSRIRAEPIPDDPTTLRIVVGGVTFERPWAEGYQINCFGGSGCQ